LAALLAGVALGWLLARLAPALHRRLRAWRGQAESWRALSPRQLLGWLDAAPNGWLILDRHNRVVHLTPRAERLLQVDPGRFWTGRPLELLSPEPPLLEVVQLARRQDCPQRLVWGSPAGDLELVALPAGGGWLALLLNSRHTLEAQLEQQERWVSDVAHELRTPLTALVLVGDSLAAHATPANAVLVQRLQRELLRLQQLVGDLLELSRLDNAMPDADVSRFCLDPGALLEQVWQDLRPIAAQRQVRLVLQREPAAGAPPLIRVDTGRVHRALLNLLDNALRYSPQGAAITVRIQDRGPWCAIAIRDQGPGFSEADLEHLFERFYRGDPSRATVQRSGSGLGLAIVQQIAVSQGGRVQASNHADGGAQMELVLPAGAAPPSGASA
jgi:two-component system, OmpR family, phosphate regulon sensor histidine kinase PhoR